MLNVESNGTNEGFAPFEALENSVDFVPVLPFGAEVFKTMDPAHEAAMIACTVAIQNSATDENDDFSFPIKMG